MRCLAILVILCGCGRLGFDVVGNADADANADATLLDIDPALLGYWKFDSVIGEVAHDSSPNQNDGMLVNGPTLVGGYYLFALDFDGMDYVTAGVRASLANIPVKTVSAWIHLTARSSNEAMIVGKDPSSGCGWQFSVGTFGEVTFRECFDLGDGVWSTLPGVIDLGNWHHVAVTYDRGNTGNLPVVYIDHSSAMLTTFQNAIGQVGDDSTRALAIGANGVDSTEDFDGIIDEVRIYGRALSSSEIGSLP